MILLIIIGIYTILIGYFIMGIKKLEITSEIGSTEELSPPFTRFSIVIPFRNEAEKLPGLLYSLSKLDYPKDCFEIVLIDDESTDESSHVIEDFKVKIPSITIREFQNVRLSAAPKKDAITLAIDKANFEWILTTDADCLVPSTWLSAYHNYITKHPVAFVAGPVTYSNNSTNSFLDQYQYLDMLSLQGVTMGSFGQGKGLLCNGANLAYTKTLFKGLNGFENNKNIASGDDVFMLENAQNKFPEKVGYLKSRFAIVETFPETSWKNLIAQRTRWAKKTSKQKSGLTKAVGIIVFLTNLSILILPVLILIGMVSIWIGVSALALKLLFDYLLLKKAGQFFSRRISVVHVFLHFYLYAIVSTWVVVRSPFTSFIWKDRKHRE